MADEFERILIAGDIEGHLDLLYKKVDKIITSHGTFTCLIVVGSFFSDHEEEWNNYKKGVKKVPIDTYILGPGSSDQLKFYPSFNTDSEQLEISDKIICLGKYGIFITSSGLKIAYLSGVESKENSLFSYGESDLLKFLRIFEGNSNYKPVDIFVTPQWPKDITTEYDAKNPSTLLRRAVKALCPRYLFCATEGVWYRRAPYNNYGRYITIKTRFIGLGKVPSKEKWLYALELTKNITDNPSHCIEPSPFKDLELTDPELKDNQFRWNLKRPGTSLQDRPKPSKSKRYAEDPQCWFCLSSPQLQKHLIVSIGSESYVASAKGGLVEDHLLISTITHIKSYSLLDATAKTEVGNYKNAINKYFKSKQCFPVFFERNLHSTQHCQIDAVPIPASRAFMLPAIFLDYATKYDLQVERHRLAYFAIPQEVTQYFYAELPTSEVLFIRNPPKFPILFARYALADPKILNKVERINWRECKETVEEEKSWTLATKETFRPFDFPKFY